jgi:hypothetical protein
VLEVSYDDGTNVGAWKDILEKVQGTVFRLVRKSFWILLISLANLFLVVQRRAVLIVTVSFLHHPFAARAISVIAEVVSADGFNQTPHLGYQAMRDLVYRGHE